MTIRLKYALEQFTNDDNKSILVFRDARSGRIYARSVQGGLWVVLTPNKPTKDKPFEELPKWVQREIQLAINKN